MTRDYGNGDPQTPPGPVRRGRTTFVVLQNRAGDQVALVRVELGSSTPSWSTTFPEFVRWQGRTFVFQLPPLPPSNRAIYSERSGQDVPAP